MPRRKEYIPQSNQEDFIVPLIKKHIDNAFKVYLSNSSITLKVLDCGCGEQPFRASIESFSHDYYGLDIKQNCQNSVNFLGEIDSEHMKSNLLNQSPFDIILCTEVLEHVLNWPLAFKNLSLLSRRGSIVLITAPYFYPLHEVPHDYWRPTSFAFEEFARLSGFRVKENQRVGDVCDVLGTLFSSIQIKPSYPRTSSRIVTRLFKFFYHLILKLLRSKYRYEINLESSHYLLNFVILERL